MQRKLIGARTALFGGVFVVLIAGLFVIARARHDIADQLAETHLLGLMELGALPPAAVSKTGGTRIVSPDSSYGRASWFGTLRMPGGRGEALVLLELRNRTWQVVYAQHRFGAQPWSGISNEPLESPGPNERNSFTIIESELYRQAMRLPGRGGLTLVDSVMKADPSRVDAYIAAARLHEHARRNEQAEAVLRAWLRRNPGTSEVLAYLGWLYTKMPGRLPDAEIYLNAAIRADATNEFALRHRALFYTMQSRHAEALRDLETACGLGWDYACRDTAARRRLVDVQRRP